MWMQALAHTRSTGSIYHHGLHPRRWKKDMFYDAKKSNSALVDIFYLKKWKLTPKLILKATGDSNNLDSFQNHHPSIIGDTGISQLYTCFTPHFLSWSQLRVSGVTCRWRSSKIPLSTRMGPGKPDARAWGTIPLAPYFYHSHSSTVSFTSSVFWNHSSTCRALIVMMLQKYATQCLICGLTRLTRPTRRRSRAFHRISVPAQSQKIEWTNFLQIWVTAPWVYKPSPPCKHFL